LRYRRRVRVVEVSAHAVRSQEDSSVLVRSEEDSAVLVRRAKKHRREIEDDHTESPFTSGEVAVKQPARVVGPRALPVSVQGWELAPPPPLFYGTKEKLVMN